jgi:ferric-dicitrate binding protein FerR (iron transport regulator)
MDAIATTLERNFAKEVVINDEELRSYHLTGSFENNSVEEILYYLSKTKPFTYRITETQIILSAVR